LEKKQIFDSVKSGELSRVDKALKENPDSCFVRTEDYRESLLHYAALQQGAEMFKLVEEHINKATEYDSDDGLPPFRETAYTSHGDNVMHYALQAKNYELVDMLMDESPELLLDENDKGVSPFAIIKDIALKEKKDINDPMLNKAFERNPETYSKYIKGQYEMVDVEVKPGQHEKSPAYGLVDYNGMLEAVSEKKKRRQAKGRDSDNFVVIGKDEFPDFIEKLKDVRDNNEGKEVNIQFAKDGGLGEHWLGGDVRKNKDGSFDFVLFDSVGRFEYTEPVAKQIKQELPDSKVRLNFDIIQSGGGQNCGLLVQSFMFHSSNQSDFNDLRQYMDEHPAGVKDVEKIRNSEKRAGSYRNDGTNVSDVTAETVKKASEANVEVGKLPLRLIRDMESLSRMSLREAESPQEVIGVVNTRGETFLQSKSKNVDDVFLNASKNSRSLGFFSKKVDQMSKHTENIVRERSSQFTVSGFNEQGIQR